MNKKDKYVAKEIHIDHESSEKQISLIKSAVIKDTIKRKSDITSYENILKWLRVSNNYTIIEFISNIDANYVICIYFIIIDAESSIFYKSSFCHKHICSRHFCRSDALKRYHKWYILRGKPE